jgi:hypothetical protein
LNHEPGWSKDPKSFLRADGSRKTTSKRSSPDSRYEQSSSKKEAGEKRSRYRKRLSTGIAVKVLPASSTVTGESPSTPG